MNYGEIKKHDIADGPGVRVSLFVSGCTHHCKGCFNYMTWDFNYGLLYTKETEDSIIEALKPSYINGLTLLGGEPFEPENERVLVGLLRRVRNELPDKNIWCYSGYTWEEINGDSRAHCEVTEEMLSLLDILVDGEFEEDKKELMLKFRGSSNQRILDVKKSLQEKKACVSDVYLDRK
ncbi:MAG: anaerobic ribonucleoside-triphosphate reductase activating protein [Lachnospiraceae bacterium]|nr:anaerobic ribonucleoside-triphosphate reductase activating protein [Lachnospiraceae bacterium]